MVSPENIQVTLYPLKLYLEKYIYVYLHRDMYISLCKTILKESKEGYMGEFGGRKEGEMV